VEGKEKSVAELSEAGERFGRAFCVGEERMATPLNELTPEEKACIERVGLNWQERVERAFGFQGLPGQGFYAVHFVDGRPRFVLSHGHEARR